MGRAKSIVVKIIKSNIANAFIKKHHYSGKVVNNSNLHMGCYLGGFLHGVMSFGCPLDKRKVLPLVNTSENKPCLWNEMLELNRMAFDEHLPKNSESRCISIAVKLLKKNAPHIRWLLSFADGCQCGDGTIYRASGFALTSVKQNNRLLMFKDGYITHGINLCHRGSPLISKKYNPDNLTENALFKQGDFNYIEGFQLRYIYLIDKTCKITVPILPFSEIDKQKAGMYKGQKVTLKERGVKSIDSDAPADQAGEGGANPTLTLQK